MAVHRADARHTEHDPFSPGRFPKNIISRKSRQCQENNAMAENATATAETTVPETMETEAAVEDTTEVTEEPQPEVTPTPEPTPEVTVEAETPQTQAAVAQPTAYTIKKGDTLIGISLRNYGSNTKVSEICALNGIADPDDIKIGQEILLP